MFGEEESSNTGSTESMTCCDVCETNASNCGEEFLDVTAELIMLVNAIDTLGLKGELKISQWIRGSNAVWTQEYDKSAPSHGNFKGHSEAWWRLFIKMCYSFGYVQREMQSLIKKMAIMQFWVYTKSQLKVVNSLLQKIISLQYH